VTRTAPDFVGVQCRAISVGCWDHGPPFGSVKTAVLAQSIDVSKNQLHTKCGRRKINFLGIINLASALMVESPHFRMYSRNILFQFSILYAKPLPRISLLFTDPLCCSFPYLCESVAIRYTFLEQANGLAAQCGYFSVRPAFRGTRPSTWTTASLPRRAVPLPTGGQGKIAILSCVAPNRATFRYAGKSRCACR